MTERKCDACNHPDFAHKKTNNPGHRYCTRDYCTCPDLKMRSKEDA